MRAASSGENGMEPPRLGEAAAQVKRERTLALLMSKSVSRNFCRILNAMLARLPFAVAKKLDAVAIATTRISGAPIGDLQCECLLQSTQGRIPDRKANRTVQRLLCQSPVVRPLARRELIATPSAADRTLSLDATGPPPIHPSFFRMRSATSFPIVSAPFNDGWITSKAW